MDASDVNEATLLAALHAVPGLDVQTGLVHLQGKVLAYRRILGHFVSLHRGDAKTILDHLDRGEHPTAERLAHSLKGASATLGVTEIHQRAARVNRSIREGQLGEALITDCQALDRLLAAFCDAVLAIPCELAQAQALSPSPSPRDAEVLAEILDWLEGGRFQVNRRTQEEASLLARQLGTAYPRFCQRVAAYDYEAAHALLKAALAAA